MAVANAITQAAMSEALRKRKPRRLYTASIDLRTYRVPTSASAPWMGCVISSMVHPARSAMRSMPVARKVVGKWGSRERA